MPINRSSGSRESRHRLQIVHVALTLVTVISSSPTPFVSPRGIFNTNQRSTAAWGKPMFLRDLHLLLRTIVSLISSNHLYVSNHRSLSPAPRSCTSQAPEAIASQNLKTRTSRPRLINCAGEAEQLTETCGVTLTGSGCGFSETHVALKACRFYQ